MSQEGQTGTAEDFIMFNGMSFKIYELFTSGNFHLLFSDCG
jgi:hypothetical protein